MSAADVAQWVGVGVSLIGAGAAWWRAGQSNRLAKEANSAAEKSNTIAQDANNIAVAANELSEGANKIAQAGYDLQREDHHVRWDGDWKGPGEYRLYNRGRDTAHAVVLDVTVGSRNVRIERSTVEPDEYIPIDAVPEAHAVIRELRHRERAQAEAEGRSHGSLGFTVPNVIAYGPRIPSGTLSYSITWTSDLGTRDTDKGRELATDYGVEA